MQIVHILRVTENIIHIDPLICKDLVGKLLFSPATTDHYF